MSHRATNWAVQQRGLKPATKIVLWHLCDRHNPDYGCFPSQEQLAYDAEISVASLNEHLRRLEEAGLIRRVRSRDPKTNRQQPTRYILGFEKGFTQEPPPESGVGFDGTEAEQQPDPTPESGDGSDSRNGPEPTPENGQSRLQNLESNPVREPLREPVKEEEDARERASSGFSGSFFSKLLETLRLDPDQLPGWWQGEAPRRHVERWMRELGLSEEAILAVAAETRLQNPEPPDGPKALDRAMARRAALDRFAADGPTRRKRAAPAASSAASETDQLAFFADWVNGDRFLPPGAVSLAMAGRLIGSGRVTHERLAQRGVAC